MRLEVTEGQKRKNSWKAIIKEFILEMKDLNFQPENFPHNERTDLPQSTLLWNFWIPCNLSKAILETISYLSAEIASKHRSKSKSNHQDGVKSKSQDNTVMD